MAYRDIDYFLYASFLYVRFLICILKSSDDAQALNMLL